VPAASNSGATSPIAAHSRLVLIAARQPSAPRAHTGQADISSRNCVTKPRGLFTTQSAGVLMLSAFTQTTYRLSASIIVY
jgi:hypothetical protein